MFIDFPEIEADTGGDLVEIIRAANGGMCLPVSRADRANRLAPKARAPRAEKQMVIPGVTYLGEPCKHFYWSQVGHSMTMQVCCQDSQCKVHPK